MASRSIFIPVACLFIGCARGLQLSAQSDNVTNVDVDLDEDAQELPERFGEQMGFMDTFLFSPPGSLGFSRSLALLRDVKLRATQHDSSSDSFVWHVHFHKAAGTSIGKLAINNGLKLAPYEPHTHGHLDLGPNNIQDKSAKQIVDRLVQLRDAGVRFGSTEHWFPDPAALAEIQTQAPWVKFMTVLRDPVERSISSYFYHFGYGNRCEDGCRGVIEFSRSEANLMTRQLNGFPFGLEALHMSPETARKQVLEIDYDPEALPRALKVLRSFHLVLILEHLSGERSHALLESKLGWTRTQMKHSNGLPIHLFQHVGKTARNKLEEMNKMDRAIYEEGVKLFHSQ